MKTNEVLEKIYLTKNLLGELFDGWNALPSNDFINIEYVRKDAFIEKASEYLEPILKEYAGFYVGEDISQHFKKYMKEA